MAKRKDPSQKKRFDIEELKSMTPAQREAFFGSPDKGTEEVPKSPPSAAQDAVQQSMVEKVASSTETKDLETEKRKEIPKNSKLYRDIKSGFEADAELQANFPEGLDSYLKFLLNAIYDSNAPDHKEVLAYLNKLKYGSLEEALAPVEVVASLKPKTEPPQEPVVVERKKPTPAETKPDQKKEKAELKFAAEPEFKYEDRHLIVNYKLENEPRDTGTKSIKVTIPKIAEIELEQQKPNLEKALVEMIKMNNFRPQPTVVVEGDKFNLQYGTAVGYTVSAQRINKILEHSGKEEQGYKEYNLEQYREAKKFRAEHPNLDFDTVGAGIRNQSIQADKVIRSFEPFLRGIPLEGRAYPTIGRVASNYVFNRLWELQAGQDKVKELQAKALEKGSGPVKTKPEAPVPASRIEAPKGNVEDKERWTKPLPWEDPEFKNKADEFYKKIEANYNNDWEKFLSHKYGRRKKFPRDAIEEYASNAKLDFPTAIRLVALKVFEGEDYSAQRTEFEKLLAMPRGQIIEILTEHLNRDNLPYGRSFKGNWLKAYIIDELRDWKLYKEKQEKKTTEPDKQPKQPEQQPRKLDEEPEPEEDEATEPLEEDSEVEAEEELEEMGLEDMIPENFELIDSTDNQLLLKDKLTEQYFVGIIKNDNLEAVALPDGYDVEDDEAMELAGKALKNLSGEVKGNYQPELKTSGQLDEAPNFTVMLRFTLAGGSVEVSSKEFIDRELLADEVKDKDEHSPMFKLLLIRRLAKLNAKSAGELTAEDKRQLKLTREALIRLAEAPRKQDLSFVQKAAREALKNCVEKLRE